MKNNTTLAQESPVNDTLKGFDCELFTLHMTRKERVNVDEPHGVLITKRKK
jgi:hypothetical protein